MKAAPHDKSALSLKRWLGLTIALSALAVAGQPAASSAATYQLDYEFAIPVGALSSPEATVTLTDIGNDMRFSVVNNLSGSKFFSLYFNFNGDRFNRDPNDLSFSNVKVNGSTLSSSKYEFVFSPSESSILSSLKADGDGYFDGKFAFKTNNFLAFNETLTFDLSLGGARNLAESDFQYNSLSGGGAGAYQIAAHVKNVNPAGDSHWVGPNPNPVPVPGAALLFGTGLAWVGRLSGRTRKNA
jgi:hypothetical protein